MRGATFSSLGVVTTPHDGVNERENAQHATKRERESSAIYDLIRYDSGNGIKSASTSARKALLQVQKQSGELRKQIQETKPKPKPRAKKTPVVDAKVPTKDEEIPPQPTLVRS